MFPAYASWLAYDRGLGPSLRKGASVNLEYLGFDAGSPPWLRGRAAVLRNGVAVPREVKSSYRASEAPAIVVNGRIAPCQRVVDLIHGALAQAVPERVIAACSGVCASATFIGEKPDIVATSAIVAPLCWARGDF